MFYQKDSSLHNKTLGELHRVIKRGISSYSNKGDDLTVSLVNVRDVQQGQINTSTVEQVAIKSTGAVDKSRLEPGDLIVTIKGINFRAAVAGELERGFVITANLIALTLTSEVLPQYVAAYLNSPAGQKEIQVRAAGASIQGLTAQSLLEIPVPIPPLEKQKKLVDYLMYYNQYVSLLNREQELNASIRDAIVQNIVR